PEGCSLPQSLRTRSADEILAKDFEDGGTRDPRQDRGLRQRQSKRRQEQGLKAGEEPATPARKSARRQPAEIGREQEDQQQAEPERGYGDADIGKEADGDIEDTVMVARRLHA